MNKRKIIEIAGIFITSSADNYINREIAISDNVVGLKIFEPPIFAFGSADDEQFENLNKQNANLKYHMLPEKWLPGSRTVISFFLPFSGELKESNKNDLHLPSEGWLHGRIEGQALINKLCIYLKDQLISAGYESLVPSLDGRFWSKGNPGSGPALPEAAFTSNWSERHVAYICGLGTFGLSKGLITRKGAAGRFGSIISALYLQPDKRDYTGIYDYCAMCGECVNRCPVKAISIENGKDHTLCSAFIDFTGKKFNPGYGCGKCQVDVPCENRIPVKD